MDEVADGTADTLSKPQENVDEHWNAIEHAFFRMLRKSSSTSRKDDTRSGWLRNRLLTEGIEGSTARCEWWLAWRAWASVQSPGKFNVLCAKRKFTIARIKEAKNSTDRNNFGISHGVANLPTILLRTLTFSSQTTSSWSGRKNTVFNQITSDDASCRRVSHLNMRIRTKQKKNHIRYQCTP